MSRCNESIALPPKESGRYFTYCQLQRGHKGDHSPQPEPKKAK